MNEPLKPLPRDGENILTAFARTPGDSRSRRVGLAALAGAGLVLTMYFSLFALQSGPIPYKLIPDLRPVVIFGMTMLVGLWAGFGGAGRPRNHFLYYVLAVTVLFHLDQATIHWLFAWAGPIGDTRVSLLRTAGSVVAVGCALLLQADHHAVTTARDLLGRGVPQDEASRARATLYAAAKSRVLTLGVGAVAIAAVLRVLEFPFDQARFGPWGGVILGIGVAVAVGVAAWRMGRGSGS